MTNEALAAQVQAGTNVREALAALHEQNRGMIWKVCRKYSYGLEMEDLMQQAYIGLHKAAFGYVPDSGAGWLSYATTAIERELSRYRNTCGQAIRIPAAEQRLYYEHERLSRYMEASYGRKPTEGEYSRYLGVSVEKVRKMEKQAHDGYVVSLDAPAGTGEEEGASLGELQASAENGIEEALERYASEELATWLWSAVNELPDELQDVVKLRSEGIALAQIGAMLGVSMQRVREMYLRGLRLLRGKKAVKGLGRDWPGCA